MAGRSTRFVGGDEVQEGDVIVDDEGYERRVTCSVLEGVRNHLQLDGSAETVVVFDCDVVEVLCGPGIEEYDHG